jgi:hypothetical protein
VGIGEGRAEGVAVVGVADGAGVGAAEGDAVDGTGDGAGVDVGYADGDREQPQEARQPS